MTWPTYPKDTGIKELDRFRANDYGLGRPTDWTYSVALDVWYAPAGSLTVSHLLRSYTDIETGTARGLRLYSVQFESGGWDDVLGWPPSLFPSMGGIDQFDFPAPSAYVEVGTLAKLRDLTVTALAVAQLPDRPVGLSQIPDATTLSLQFHRKNEVVIRAHNEEKGIFVRAMAIRERIEQVKNDNVVTYRASLHPRTVRLLVKPGNFTPQDISFQAPESATSASVVSMAKQKLGCPGHPAQRIPGTDTWKLTGVAWELTLEKVDESAVS